MPLNAGVRVGPYEVLGVIGAGGMGEVYRARDTKLQRDVAIKVLPAAMAANPARLQRLEREARALAALNHPNIATVYGLEDPPALPEFQGYAAHGRAIVMELVEGEDLSVRLLRGPLPLADALAVARQVAEALAAAHDAGIVHRDLKPANIKVRDDGAVKVLDFGLAKGGPAASVPASGSGSGSGSGPGTARNTGSDPQELPPTLTVNGGVSEDGAVLGTAAYMAPEQAKGKTVDKRADIWSFGVVLFEMLAGRRPFAGGDPADTLAHVLAADPDWDALPSDTPPSVRRLLARCLTKERKQRLHDIADARLEIDEALAQGRTSERPAEARRAANVRSGSGARRLLAAVLCLAAGVAIGAALWRMRAPTPPVTHARLDVAPAAELSAGGVHPSVVLPAGGARTALAWSPDGRMLAFIGSRGGLRQVYLRTLAEETARPLAGTEGARALTFSPDGQEVAFWSDGAIRKVKVTGGPPAKICDSSTLHGLSWGATRIVYSMSPALLEVSPSGGESRQVTSPPELVRHASPFILPGDSALLFTEYEKQWTSGDERVMVQSLAPGAQPKVLLREAADARYLTTGHLAFVRQGTLFVVPFDVQTLTLRGEPVAVVKDVAQAVAAWDSDDLTLAGQFAVSPDGMLAYVSAPLAAFPDGELVSIDRAGRMTTLEAPPRGYRNHVDISPDGTRLAVSIQSTTDIRLFSYDLARGSLSRVAEPLKGEVILAAWSEDDRIAVQVVDNGRISAAIVRPETSSPAVPVAESTGFWASSFSPQGNLVGMKGGHLWLYTPNAKDARPTELLNTKAIETQPMWSPDGRWIAYTSNTTGRLDVYLRPYPGPGEAVIVSTNGGSSPAWNPNGRELFYVEPGRDEDRMMAAAISAPGHAEKPHALFAIPHGGLLLGATVLTPYAVARDGQHFYAIRQVHTAPVRVTQLNVILNWFEELKAGTPLAR